MINNYPLYGPYGPVPNQEPQMEARFLGLHENINDVIVRCRTVFIDEQNKVVAIKEANGNVSKIYGLILPKDEKDVKIEQLEQKLIELEGKLNGFNEYSKPIEKVEQSNAIIDGDVANGQKKSSK